MARRKTEKFTLTKLLLAVAILIWIPQLLRMLAGVPGGATPSSGPSPARDGGAVPEVEARPVSWSPSSGGPFATGDVGDGASESLSPAPSELVLETTFISVGRRTAIINGLAYSEGDQVEARDDCYVVATIRAESVELEANGRRYRLRLKSYH